MMSPVRAVGRTGPSFNPEASMPRRRPFVRADLVSPLLFAGLLAQGPAPCAAQDLVLRNARVVDVVDGRVLEARTVIVEGGRIRSLSGEGSAPAGARVVDLRGMYLAPGLMDAHVHVATEDQARRALESGVTTARSAGAAWYADVGLARLIRGGWARGPELLAAGYHVRPDIGEAFFVDNPDLGRFRTEGIRSHDAIREAVRANLSRGVDFVKTTSTERAGLPQTDPRKQLYDAGEVAAMVEEARARGVPVMAHAHGDSGARAAVEAGVRSVEHGTYMSEATLRLMAERGTFLVPTVAIVADLTVPGGDYDNAVLNVRGRHMLPRVREMARTARQLGVRIVAATDTGYGPESTTRVAHELIELVEHVGMTPAEALRSATTVAAELFGLSERTGRIAEGMEADLIVVERNPLEDVSTVQDVLLVVSDGKVVAQRGDWPAAAPISDGER